MENFKIKKVILFSDSGQEIKFDSSNIEKFFLMSRINPRKPFATLFLRLNKIKLAKILLIALFRKIKGNKIAMTEELLLSIFFRNMNFKKIVQVEADVLGKKILFNLEKIHLLNLLGDLRGVIENNQYNLKTEKIKNKIVVDAGAHNGEFSILSVLLGAKKVYAFEPVSGTAEILEKNISLNNMEDKITIVKKALSNKNGRARISFDYVGDGGASITSEVDKNFEDIETVSLDNFVKENKIERIDFVKMDVEGFEENVIIGSAEIMKKFKPILSLSAYHKPDDKVKLPKRIKSIREDYKIVLNTFDEEDFYCK